PQVGVVGMKLYFARASDPDNNARLGEQAGFAVRVSLDLAVDQPATVWRLKLIDGEDEIIDVPSGSLIPGRQYRVASGSITYAGVAYGVGDTFVATAAGGAS